MKKALLLLSICAITFCMYFVSAKSTSDSQSFSVSDNDETYKITASYNKKKDKNIQQALHRFIKPNDLFKSGDVTYDGSIKLSDNTTFDLRFFPGELKIKLDKKKNSSDAYNKMKKLSADLQEALK